MVAAVIVLDKLDHRTSELFCFSVSNVLLTWCVFCTHSAHQNERWFSNTGQVLMQHWLDWNIQCLLLIFLGLPLLSGLSKVKETGLIPIYTMMHQHFARPGSIEVCQHLTQPVTVNRVADMTCPAPVIELLAICQPWLSCCHIIFNLVVGAVYHTFIRFDRRRKENFCSNLRMFFMRVLQ